MYTAVRQEQWWDSIPLHTHGWGIMYDSSTEESNARRRHEKGERASSSAKTAGYEV